MVRHPKRVADSGKCERLKAPSAKIAALAYETSLSSASMAPLAAMIAETPQIEEPEG
jgi:hypothetical protein